MNTLMYLPVFGNSIHACLIQVACLIEVATKTGFTVSHLTSENPNSGSKITKIIILLLLFSVSFFNL